MAATHKQVVKVWIAPGCIVCDACETDCPEVFDVQEETCVIRPDAKNAEFTKPLTPSIIVAAEGCPVEVIKFETIEVEGPEPWAGKEPAAAAAGGGGGGGGHTASTKKTGWVPPEGAPDPKWAALLSQSRTSGSRSAGGATVGVRRAKAPAEAIARAVPADAPPDAMAAAMVGSGFARPATSVAQRIRDKAKGLTRREVVAGISGAAAAAWALMAATAGTLGGAFQSFLVPKVTREPPSTFRAGKLSDYPTPGVYEQFKPQNVWIVHLADGKLVALSTICTHLGCIPNWIAADQKFKCPCHGSGFYVDGVNFEGPAPRPLERLRITLEGEFVVVDKSAKFRQELKQWGLPGSELLV